MKRVLGVGRILPMEDEQFIEEYNEYLDWLEAAVGEQELPEDFKLGVDNA